MKRAHRLALALSLGLGPLHGYAIAARIEQVSNGAIQLNMGTLYPALIGAVAPAKPFPIRIIGVAPAGFEGVRRGERADVWIPSRLVHRVASNPGAALDAGSHVPMMVFARLFPGETPADAERRWQDI